MPAFKPVYCLTSIGGDIEEAPPMQKAYGSSIVKRFAEACAYIRGANPSNRADPWPEQGPRLPRDPAHPPGSARIYT
jgi:hypothetical protein